MSRVVAAVAVALAAIGGLTACGGDSSEAERRAETAALPGRGDDRRPAAASGGVCQLLDYYAVEQLIGVRFEVAAAAQRDATATCVLQRNTASYPDLTLAITPSTLTAKTFGPSVAPPGAVALAGVGQAGYQLVRPAAAGGDPAGPGPGVEIGWLTRTAQLMVLRFRLSAQSPQAEVEALTPRLVDLVKFLDPA